MPLAQAHPHKTTSRCSTPSRTPAASTSTAADTASARRSANARPGPAHSKRGGAANAARPLLWKLQPCQAAGMRTARLPTLDANAPHRNPGSVPGPPSKARSPGQGRCRLLVGSTYSLSRSAGVCSFLPKVLRGRRPGQVLSRCSRHCQSWQVCPRCRRRQRALPHDQGSW